MLEVTDLSKSFRGLQAVREVGFAVPEGAVFGLIGPNGAGKTTIFNLIAGALRPDGGTVTMEGRDITGWRADRVCHAGIARTFQIARPLAHLTVIENVVVGALRATSAVPEARERAAEMLALLDLSGKAQVPAGSLTLPERKRLEVAKALATGPRLLLLDEVMAGLRPAETDRMVEIFRKLNTERGVTILLIEHVMRAVMALSHTVAVLHHGELIAAGEPKTVVRDPKVIESYLGEEAV